MISIFLIFDLSWSMQLGILDGCTAYEKLDLSDYNMKQPELFPN